jgi:transcriptional regulator with XRE-family HTH domain
LREASGVFGRRHCYRFTTGGIGEGEVRMVLLRRVIGDALRARRQGQHRTLREVSTAANVSLGYLSEIERGQKEASSELLGSICEALGAQLSDVLREVSDTLALAEQMDGLVATPDRGDEAAVPAVMPVTPTPVSPSTAAPVPAGEPAARAARASTPVRQVASDGKVKVSVRQNSPLKATLHAKRTAPTTRERNAVLVA